MPKVSDMIVSKFLKKEDFPDDEVVTIKDLSLEEVGQGGETKWVLFFKEHTKGMILNVTTIRVLEAAFGDDSDAWIGHKVKLYVDPNVTMQGKVVGGLRLMPPRKPLKPPAPVAPPPKETTADTEFDDDIPF